jgi:peptidoglycan/LPS O-acetylase OafA/YrhL
VLFHAFPKVIEGGFIGVDIFFVISGFLISTIIFESLENRTFSLFGFWSRRVKRIFPALILVLLSSLAFGWMALLADEYSHLSKHISAGAGFVSNFVLWQEAGYFDNSADTKPLLHLWSLGIEEQFYLAWPLIIWAAWKRKFNILAVVFFIAILSFYLNIRGIYKDSISTFYSPLTRFWELASGGLLAWIIFFKKKQAGRESKIGNLILLNLISFIGFFLLIYGFFRLNKNLNFPGWFALLPVMGSLFLITAGPGAWINKKILSNPMVVWIGLISYPLYLWHWPLLTFSKILEAGSRGRNISLLLSFLLAYLTYKLIEQPIRQSKNQLLIPTLITLMFFIGFVGYKIHTNDGLINRNAAVLRESKDGDIGNYDFFNYMATKYYTCTPEKIAKEALKEQDFVRCLQSKNNTDVDIALLGDSHSEHLFPGIADALPKKNIAFYIKAGLPFLNNPEFKNIFENIISNKKINIVIISSYWNKRFKELSFESDPSNELVKVIDLLEKSGKKVYLTDDIPTFPFKASRCKGARWISSEAPLCQISADNFKFQSEAYAEVLNKTVIARPSVKIIAIGKYICNQNVCSMAQENNILYRDRHHLNVSGSLFIWKRAIQDNQDIFN